MFSIQLQNLVFKCFHGVYAEEKIIGGTFVVNLLVRFNISSSKKIALDDTLNYEKLFHLVSHHMNQPTELLENLVVTISNDLFLQFKQIQEISISITKKNPPIKNFVGDVTVTHQTKRS